MDSTDLRLAREALRDREDLTGKHWASSIGSWETGQPEPVPIAGLAGWAAGHGIDAVIWTALKPKFDGDDRTPTEEEVVDYLGGLRGTRRDNAERYIRLTPRQVDTQYRRRIEAALGWTCSEIDSRVITGWSPQGHSPVASSARLHTEASWAGKLARSDWRPRRGSRKRRR
jgi:hypothetical protein